MEHSDSRHDCVVWSIFRNASSASPLQTTPALPSWAPGATGEWFRAAGATVGLTRGTCGQYDSPMRSATRRWPLPGGRAADSKWAAFPSELEQSRATSCHKASYGGPFTGLSLELQLRRRGSIRTLVIGGIATNMGVESTAVRMWEHGYAVISPKTIISSINAN